MAGQHSGDNTQKAKSNGPLGQSIPAYTAHAVSVSLPLWEDNVGYEKGDRRVLDTMENGYPRFFIHLTIQDLQSAF